MKKKRDSDIHAILTFSLQYSYVIKVGPRPQVQVCSLDCTQPQQLSPKHLFAILDLM